MLGGLVGGRGDHGDAVVVGVVDGLPREPGVVERPERLLDHQGAVVDRRRSSPAAKRLTSATKLSPTRMCIAMQLGQVPSSPPLFGLRGRVLGLAGAVPVLDVVVGVVVVVEEVPADHVVDEAVAVVVVAVA